MWCIGRDVPDRKIENLANVTYRSNLRRCHGFLKHTEPLPKIEKFHGKRSNGIGMNSTSFQLTSINKTSLVTLSPLRLRLRIQTVFYQNLYKRSSKNWKVSQ
jgi:hypothetical protein